MADVRILFWSGAGVWRSTRLDQRWHYPIDSPGGSPPPQFHSLPVQPPAKLVRCSPVRLVDRTQPPWPGTVPTRQVVLWPSRGRQSSHVDTESTTKHLDLQFLHQTRTVQYRQKNKKKVDLDSGPLPPCLAGSASSLSSGDPRPQLAAVQSRGRVRVEKGLRRGADDVTAALRPSETTVCHRLSLDNIALELTRTRPTSVRQRPTPGAVQ